jgi:hypothetical protein
MAGPCDDRWTPMPTRFRRVAALVIAAAALYLGLAYKEAVIA